MKEKIILIGDGGHARVVADILEEIGSFEIIGGTTIDDTRTSFLGYPVIGNDDILPLYFKKGIKRVAMGLGGFTSNTLRKKVFNYAKGVGFEIITVIHPKAMVSRSAMVGEGSVLFAGAVLNTAAKVGSNCIIATGATIDHESSVGDHSLISAGVTIGANVEIGAETLCALGSKVISGKKIGMNVLVAAGGVVVNDIPAGQKVFGIPARPRT
jgi:UDP-perosamine 4-acetyltransferase